MKNKWIIPIVLFIVLVIAYAARGLVQSRIELELLQEGKIEETVSTQGVLIKKEKAESLTLGGTTEIYAKNGARVANKEIIASLQAGTEDEALKTELAQISKKINAIHKSNADGSAYISDSMQMETELSNCVDKLIEASKNNDYTTLSENKYKIQMITAQKAIARGETVTTPAEEVIRLQTRKNEIEAILGKSANIISAQMAGIFIEGKDGYEETLTPETIQDLVPDTIKSIIKENGNGNMVNDENQYVYKIVDNFSYHIAINLDKEMTKGLEIGNTVDIRFSNFSEQDNKAIVKFISEPDKDGVSTIVVECDRYVEKLLSQRVVNVDFVKKSVSGYKVKVEHIHTVDNTVGLFVKRGAVMRFLPVDIKYSNEEEAIVSSADGSMPIKSYDEVVVAAPEFRDGRVIVSQ